MPHNDILAKLKDAIRSVSDNIQNYVSNPGDFSRNGKLPANVLMEFLIGQGSRSTRNELIDAFSYDKDHPSASALVQKRAKLSPAALRDVLYRFNQSLEPSSSNSNYRFFAADGSTAGMTTKRHSNRFMGCWITLKSVITTKSWADWIVLRPINGFPSRSWAVDR